MFCLIALKPFSTRVVGHADKKRGEKGKERKERRGKKEKRKEKNTVDAT